MQFKQRLHIPVIFSSLSFEEVVSKRDRRDLKDKLTLTFIHQCNSPIELLTVTANGLANISLVVLEV